MKHLHAFLFLLVVVLFLGFLVSETPALVLDTDVQHCTKNPGTDTVEPGESHMTPDGVVVVNDGKTGEFKVVHCDGCETHAAHTDVEAGLGARGSVTGLNGGDTLKLKGKNILSINSNNGTRITVSGSNSRVVHNGISCFIVFISAYYTTWTEYGDYNDFDLNGAHGSVHVINNGYGNVIHN